MLADRERLAMLLKPFVLAGYSIGTGLLVPPLRTYPSIHEIQ